MSTHSIRPACTDVTFRDEGTIVLRDPLTARAASWFEEHTPDAQRFGHAIVVEHRYVADIVAGLSADGLVIRRRAEGLAVTLERVNGEPVDVPRCGKCYRQLVVVNGSIQAALNVPAPRCKRRRR
jgi:hypothetical protein